MELFNKKISGPFTIPSGIITTQVSTLQKIAKEIPEIGILTTKSIGIEKREGNREPIIVNFAPLSFINAVGLANPGADKFKEELAKIKIPRNKFLLISIFGKDEKEFSEVAQKLKELADGFELNLSCPHSTKYGQVIGQDFALIEKIVKKVSNLQRPVFIKVSPNLDYKKMVDIAIEAGAKGVTAINTVGPGLCLKDGNPILSNITGGISGRAIMPLGLKIVKEIREMGKFPIIACGGISTIEDVLSYKTAGADFFGIGSALYKMDADEIKHYFKELNLDLKKGTNKAGKKLHKDEEEYKKFMVLGNKSLTKDLFVLKLKGGLKIEPGQFVFLWQPKFGEKPFSVFDENPLTFIIRKVGCFTEKLLKIRKGEFLYLRGPYGKNIKTRGKTMLVGGGTGIASLLSFAKANKKAIALLGAREKELLSFANKYLKNISKVYTCRGMLTEILEKVIKKEKPQFIVNCGRKEMIENVLKIETKFISKNKIFSSTEYLTKCGIGICGSCATEKGYRSCVDGSFLQTDLS